METASSTATVLVVDDDLDVAELVSDSLASSGYHVKHAGSAAEAHAVLDEMTPDLIILDLGLPDANGLVVCGDLKARVPVPVIVCSGSAHAYDPVLSRRLGADDYVRKPFRPADLEARVTGLLRQQAERARELERTIALTFPAPLSSSAEQRIGDLVLDHSRRIATLGGTPLPLTPTEFRLLTTFADALDEVMSREELGRAIWGAYDAGIGRSIDVHVTHLRAKLAEGSGRAPTIVVSRGFGFRLVPPPSPAPVTVDSLRAARDARSWRVDTSRSLA